MKITDYLNKNCIKPDLNGKSKKDIIKELLDCLKTEYPDIDSDAAYNEVLEREELESTSIGGGISIPHARVRGIDDIYLAVGLLKNEPDFLCLDGTPVHIVFLILFPKERIDLQLRFLARVARLLRHRDLYDDLIACDDSEKVVRVIRTYDDKYTYES